jgi:HEAT repeat protein
MKGRRRNLLLVLVTLVLSFATLQSGVAQKTPGVGSAKLYRYGELLKEHKIELTEPALLEALKNPDASVRYLAAMKLAEDKAVNAIPAIEQALTAENVPRTRVNIALALGLLGDQAGIDELKNMCADKNFVPEFRLYAVRYMFDLHSEKDEDCLSAAEEILESKNANFGDRVSALELLPRFQDLTPDESRRIFRLFVSALEDSEPVVRMAASQSLAGLGNASAIPYLKAAIAREQEEGVRSVFDSELRKLQAIPKQ